MGVGEEAEEEQQDGDGEAEGENSGEGESTGERETEFDKFSSDDESLGIRTGTRNENVEPFPTSLVARMVPPIASTNCLQIASPNPVPAHFRKLSSFVNVWNNNPILFGSIPGPVSVTENSKTIFFSVSLLLLWYAILGICSSGSSTGVTYTTTSPSSVNLHEFPTRFTKTCRSFVTSLVMEGGHEGCE